MLTRVENAVSLTALTAMVLLALSETAGRALFQAGVPGSIVLVQHLTLWVALLGAALAARSDRLLALATPHFLPERWRNPTRVGTATVATAIAATLTLASLDLIAIERRGDSVVAWGIPLWAVLTVLPAAFGVIAIRLISRAATTLRWRLVAAAGLALPAMYASWLNPSVALLPSAIVIAVATAMGLPLFTAIGGAALLLFWSDATPINAVPGEAYRLTTSPMLPAIPLFALGGYVLAAGQASQRLTRLCTALVGWIPGGLAIVVVLVLAFFTPLTGASGVTILSMGGLLLPVLVGSKYQASTSIGLVTVSGSIGLLFFPSLPVFLYAFYANVPFERIFVGGLVPGILLMTVVAGWAALRSPKRGAMQTAFVPREALLAAWDAKWELLLPLVVLGTLVAGVTTLVESAAIAVLYVTVVECFVHRELSLRRDLPRVGVECATLVGGFMIILCVALGLTNYLILTEVPARLLEWVQQYIQSPVVFLLVLNVLLVAVGAIMDIYSAIIIVVPLIVPIAAAFGIDATHLAIIFLANMELGYLMPPMGENLFLSAYRFDEPLLRIYRYTLPYTVLIFVAVLVITYVPALTLWLVHLLEQLGYLGVG
jgi:C4-dicarboxylate transporter, DctM subunit